VKADATARVTNAIRSFFMGFLPVRFFVGSPGITCCSLISSSRTKSGLGHPASNQDGFWALCGDQRSLTETAIRSGIRLKGH
jgi:hypothetical protein